MDTLDRESTRPSIMVSGGRKELVKTSLAFGEKFPF
jgi:hypothetical protein